MKFLFTMFILATIISDVREISDLKMNPIPKKEDVQNFESWRPFVVVKKDGKVYYEFSGEKWDKRVKLDFEIDRGKEKEPYFTDPTNSIKVHNGLLVGFNRGEWGGALYWYSTDGKRKYLISNGNVENIIKFKEKIYITQGLAHLTGDYGVIREINFIRGKWKEGNKQILDGCPEQSLNNEDKLLIITTKNVVLVNSELIIEKKFEYGFLQGLYPNSVVVDKDIAYFGMRGGVLKLNIVNGIDSWLTE